MALIPVESAAQVFDTTPLDTSKMLQGFEPTAVVAAPKNNVSLADLAARGFGGLVFDWTSFPMIKLDNGLFEDSIGCSYGVTFKCKVMESKPKYAHSFDKSSDPKTELLYSYDKIIGVNGTPVADFEAQLRAKGHTPNCKAYLEAMVELMAPGLPYDGEFRLLSIPPSSTGRLSALIYKMTRKGEEDVIINCSIGDRVKVGQNSYNPWAFTAA